MWLPSFAVVLIAQTGHDGHNHDHSAHATVPTTFQTRADYVQVATDTGLVQTIGQSPQFWSAMPSSPTMYTVPTGTALTFWYSAAHNLYLLETHAGYESCDLGHSTELATATHGGETNASLPANKYTVVITVGGMYHFTCHVPGHCAAGQKIMVTVVDPASPPPPPSAPSPPSLPGGSTGSPPSPPSLPGSGNSGGDSGCGGGCIGGIVGGSFVPVLMLVLWLSGSFGSKCPSPLRPPPKSIAFDNAA